MGDDSHQGRPSSCEVWRVARQTFTAGLRTKGDEGLKQDPWPKKKKDKQ
jgi:hypothetical protein